MLLTVGMEKKNKTHTHTHTHNGLTACVTCTTWQNRQCPKIRCYDNWVWYIFPGNRVNWILNEPYFVFPFTWKFQTKENLGTDKWLRH